MAVDFYLGDWLIQPTLNRATRDGRLVHLRPKVMDVLVVLSARPGAVLSKDALLEGAWGTEFVSESALTSVVAELRQAFDDNVERPWLIETIPKRGYRLLAEVRPPAAAALPPPPAPIGQKVALARGDISHAGSSSRGRVLLFALAGATAVGLSALWLNTPVTRVDSPIREIAVLPFGNLSGNPADELLAHAITDGLISELARLDGLERVIAHESVMRYKARPPSLREIANDLHVEGFITGTLTRIDDSRLGVRVELIDARTERQLWSDTFMPDARSVVDVQRQVVRDIVREARITVTPRQLRRLKAAGPRTDPQAYESVVKARAESARINYRTAVEYYEKALSRDPEMAQAWAELALTLVYQAYGEPRHRVIARARAAADRALELDPEIAEARVALGRIRLHVDWDWDGAGRELRSAVLLDPHSPDARWNNGFYLGVMGRLDESLKETREAVRLDPHSPFTHYQLAFQLRVARQYQNAVDEFTKAVALADRRPIYLEQRALAHALNGDCSLADTDLAASGRSSFAGFVAAKCGRPDEARRLAAAVRKDGGCAADVYAALHDYDAAFACLEERYARRDFSLAQLGTAPLFVDLQNDPRFGDLLQRMGYPR